ncbi:MAG: integrase core domain-containing protein, partial [Candidatus Brocadia sp.]|nr:integrase core domain-containing protein [Candidatus Brocadia sp.]
LKTHSSQFKLCYQYRQYHFQFHDILHSSPQKPKIDLSKIHNSDNTLGLILTFYVSFAITARKTASILKSVFNLPVSYQTVLNYAEAAAYHVADNRGVQPAIAAMHEATRTAPPEQEITLVTDGNPSYPSGIHFLNSLRTQNNYHSSIQHHKVIGLQNLDKESEEFRPFKQLIERLNRTYKHHVKPANGFNSYNGAVSLTTLFVTHYNFLRPHMALGYKTPVPLPELDSISTIQGKWLKILSLAA